MAGLSIAVLADDLTGAAEIAAIGNRHGLPTRILAANAQQPPPFAGLSVYDTDSRLLPANEAVQRVNRIAFALRHLPPAAVFKKTDSVLRGNVAAECTALVQALGRSRTLLAPANPSLGRTIAKGHYFIKGIPIHETAFAHDPHHPAKTSLVIDLLAAPGSPAVPVVALSPGSALPQSGLAIGEADSPTDVASWAAVTDEHTLPAGGAEFFQAWLGKLGLSPKPSTTPGFSSPALVVTGSLTPARDTLLNHAATARWPVHALLPDSSAELLRSLASQKLALVQSPRIALDNHDMAARIRAGFGQLIRDALANIPIGHLVVEGGATAAAISESMGWTSFDVAGEWAPGVIALRPALLPALLFTIKPGSYSWPGNLWRQLDNCLAAPAKS